MEGKYKPLWINAVAAIVVIFIIIFGIGSMITYKNMFTVQTLAGVLLGVLYISTMLRFTEKRSSQYLDKTEGKFGKYITGAKKERSSDIIARIPKNELDDYGQALQLDLSICKICMNVYVGALVVSYFMLLPR